jgi:hypothetical protein
MDSSSRSLWQCSTCNYAKNTWAAVECKMCGAVISSKRPALPVPASVAVASKRNKLARKTAVAKKPPPQDPPPPVHPSGIIVNIVGTNRGDRGRRCEEHDVCGLAVLAEDVLVRVRKEQILVPDNIAGKGKMKEQTALTVNWVSDGIDRCRVNFLPQAYNAQGRLWNGVLCQVVSVGSPKDPCAYVRRKCHHYCGYARVAVVSNVPVGVKEIADNRFEAMAEKYLK